MSVVAFDLGASGGRALLGRLTDRRIVTEELHRFPNDPVQLGARLHWDILRLYHEIKIGLLRAKLQGDVPVTLAIDSWAVDFGLIGANGELLGNPYHYRDAHTDGMIDEVAAIIPCTDLYKRTGIQYLPFNTIYQLAAMRKARSPLLKEAKRFLMIPDLLRYFLTGDMHNEFTNATTTQLYNPIKDGWDDELLRMLDIPASLFAPALKPGSFAGELRASVSDELGLPRIRVIAAAEHDTASAVAAIPALTDTFAYVSCGTWSLIGTEMNRPIMSELAERFNFTNEGGFGGTFRLLKNVMGLWILQETQRALDRDGAAHTYSELLILAERELPFTVFIDPDDHSFLAPGDMRGRIREYARRTGQKQPERIGEFVRCILESLALKYRYALELTELVSGRRFNGLHMVGGGSRNALLCQWSANAIGRPVWAGPAEGSAIGNMVVQWIASRDFSGLADARRAIAESFPIMTYEPELSDRWEEAYGRFRAVTGLLE